MIILVKKSYPRISYFAGAKFIWFFFLAVVALVQVVMTQANGATVLLNSGNSTAGIETEHFLNLYSWAVDGVEHNFGQGLWYRIGSDPESNIGLLPSTPPVTSSNAASVVYNQGLFTLAMQYSLFGGAPGSGESSLNYIASATNTSNEVLDLHLFLYIDLDIDGQPDNEGQIIGGTTAIQTGLLGTQATITANNPNHSEISLYPELFDQLNFFGPTTLNDSGAQIVGDMAFAFQWDVVLNPGNSFLIFVNESIGQAAIPEPAVMAMLGFACLFLIRRRRSQEE